MLRVAIGELAHNASLRSGRTTTVCASASMGACRFVPAETVTVGEKKSKVNGGMALCKNNKALSSHRVSCQHLQ